MKRINFFGAWLSPVERSVWDREVGCSNHLAPTNQFFSVGIFICPLIAFAFKQAKMFN